MKLSEAVTYDGWNTVKLVFSQGAYYIPIAGKVSELKCLAYQRKVVNLARSAFRGGGS